VLIGLIDKSNRLLEYSIGSICVLRHKKTMDKIIKFLLHPTCRTLYNSFVK